MSFAQEFPHPLAGRNEPQEPLGGPGASPAASPAELAARLSSAEQTLRDISHALAHDLRTSLRHVVSYAQLLGDVAQTVESEPAQRLSHKVVDASRQLQRLMESVSALARLQAADLKLRTELLTKALQLQNDDVAHIPLHNQVIPWAMKKNIDVVHRADNRLDWRLIKVN